jgi:hypothetical protein
LSCSTLYKLRCDCLPSPYIASKYKTKLQIKDYIYCFMNKAGESGRDRDRDMQKLELIGLVIIISKSAQQRPTDGAP